MATIYGANTLSSGYDVANSLRFEDGSTDYLQRTFGTSSNSKKFTWSFWIKRTRVGTSEYVFENVGSHTLQGSILFDSSDRLQLFEDNLGAGSNTYLITNRKFRDVAAWYHIVIAVDSTQATDTNRAKIYVNGVQETSFATSTYPSQDHALPYISGSGDPCNIGKYDNTNGNLSGYLCEMVFKDGAQLDPTSFGEFNSNDVWIPKDLSDFDFSGTNTFFLEFKQTGTSQNSSGIGADTSGRDNHFTVNNLTAVDQSTDTCTNNYNTMNPLENYYGAQTYTEGNLKSVSPSGNAAAPIGTIGVSNGRWYAEAKLTNQSSNQTLIGISSNYATQTDFHLGRGATSYGMYSNGGAYYVNNGSANAYGTSYTTNDIIGIYIDLTSNKLYFSKNGTLLNSGTGISITAAASTEAGAYFFSGMQWDNSGTCTWEWNFGSGTTYSISSGNSDDNGYGNFEYSPNITGDSTAKSFYALNTKNLAQFG